MRGASARCCSAIAAVDPDVLPRRVPDAGGHRSSCSWRCSRGGRRAGAAVGAAAARAVRAAAAARRATSIGSARSPTSRRTRPAPRRAAGATSRSPSTSSRKNPVIGVGHRPGHPGDERRSAARHVDAGSQRLSAVRASTSASPGCCCSSGCTCSASAPPGRSRSARPRRSGAARSRRCSPPACRCRSSRSASRRCFIRSPTSSISSASPAWRWRCATSGTRASACRARALRDGGRVR